MHKKTWTACLPILAATLALIGGCSKQEGAPVTEATSFNPSSGSAEESYDCSSTDNSNPLKQSWCEAHTAFNKRGDQASGSFNLYLKGYRQGSSDASQARSSRIPRAADEKNQDGPEETGYRDGYQSIITQAGLIEFDCTSNDPASEYRERWCEAADAYRVAGLGDDNPFLKNRYIDGYMAGGRIALTVPTSMESFLSGDAPESKQPAIIQPEGDLEGAQLAFYRGFDEGYKAMIASIRESINQVMEQMQMPGNMPPEEGGGMPPPMGN